MENFYVCGCRAGCSRRPVSRKTADPGDQRARDADFADTADQAELVGCVQRYADLCRQLPRPADRDNLRPAMAAGDLSARGNRSVIQRNAAVAGEVIQL